MVENLYLTLGKARRRLYYRTDPVEYCYKGRKEVVSIFVIEIKDIFLSKEKQKDSNDPLRLNVN